MEDRYSVLVEFEDQKSADGFYLDLNGWRFSSSEVLFSFKKKEKFCFYAVYRGKKMEIPSNIAHLEQICELQFLWIETMLCFASFDLGYFC